MKCRVDHGCTVKSRRGFTLFEVLLATVILGLGAASVTQVVFNGVDAGQRVRQDSIAVVLCESKLEERLAFGGSRGMKSDGVFPNDPKWSWSVRQIPATDSALTLVSVTVKHESFKGTSQTLSRLVRKSSLELARREL